MDRQNAAGAHLRRNTGRQSNQPAFGGVPVDVCVYGPPVGTVAAQVQCQSRASGYFDVLVTFRRARLDVENFTWHSLPAKNRARVPHVDGNAAVRRRTWTNQENF